ncbi:MAG: ATP-binding cassette domain-containing protein [Alphaproteobacteria bacterium]|nr:ATP-binding cassette domain-containing protein [Alphaproteobacteria bacterium]MDX5369139.1 ATP-binding cassette domain-containing protein [Alphaproteobacteria bacterium]MDX5463835.1 ATP-binding cassette domain-containing protein [Alphaproteobacteria bacterium]
MPTGTAEPASDRATIRVTGLTRRFGARRAVEDVSFALERGDVMAFLGPNGAGKTTTMRMIAGFLAPDAGAIEVAGIDVLRHPRRAQAVLGYLPEGAPAYGEMSAAALLAFQARARGLAGAAGGLAVARAMARTALEEVAEQRIDTLSKGYRRRVALAGAILHDPPVLLLDEPTDGLDPNQKREVRALIRTLRQGTAILLSTHALEEVEAVCNRVAVIAEGRLVADTTPAALAAADGAPGAGDMRARLEAVFARLTGHGTRPAQRIP